MRIYKDRGIFTFNGAELDIRIADNNGVPLNSLWNGEKRLIDANGDKPDYFNQEHDKIVEY